MNIQSARGGIDIKEVYGEWTTSYLLIRNAGSLDSGIYTCAPAGGVRTSIKVHVFLEGKSIVTPLFFVIQTNFTHVSSHHI